MGYDGIRCGKMQLTAFLGHDGHLFLPGQGHQLQFRALRLRDLCAVVTSLAVAGKAAGIYPSAGAQMQGLNWGSRNLAKYQWF